MEITSGKIEGALKIVVYGPEGIGKSTFASQFPNSLFIDTEGSTKQLDVRRLPTPTSWTMLMQEIEHVRKNPDLCGTLVIDTADWAEKLCHEHVCADNKWPSIETPGYGKGIVMAGEEYGRLLNALDMVIDQGINVVLVAHAMMRKFEQPDELGSYDRWELKLSKKAAPMVKEWADAVLFVNYKTFVVMDGKKGKVQGGERVMYTSHHPAWDAKNRMGLAPELSFSFSHIAEHIPGKGAGPWAYADSQKGADGSAESAPRIESEHFMPPIAEMPLMQSAPEPEEKQKPEQPAERPDGIPDNLWQLMQADGISEELVRFAVYKRGYMPLDAPFTAYDPGFIQGVLVGAWPKIKEFIDEIKGEMPF